MESVAELNNKGIRLLCTAHLNQAQFYEAHLCFEKAVRLLSQQNGKDLPSTPGQTQSESSNNISGSASDYKVFDHLSEHSQRQMTLIAPTNIIGFCISRGENECTTDFMAHSENNRNSRLNLYTEYFSLLESRGIAINLAVLRAEIQNIFNDGQVDYETYRDYETLLLYIISAAVVFNMALGQHLAGLCNNESVRFYRAWKLYKVARLSLCSATNMFLNFMNESPPLILEVLYMATLNNEGFLAHAMADYGISQHCFENLRKIATTCCSTLRTQDHDAKNVSNADHDSIGLRAAGDHDHQLTRPCTLRSTAYAYFLNAYCYRVTVQAAAA